jgi:hypothetical protein
MGDSPPFLIKGDKKSLQDRISFVLGSINMGFFVEASYLSLQGFDPHNSKLL